MKPFINILPHLPTLSKHYIQFWKKYSPVCKMVVLHTTLTSSSSSDTVKHPIKKLEILQMELLKCSFKNQKVILPSSKLKRGCFGKNEIPDTTTLCNIIVFSFKSI